MPLNNYFRYYNGVDSIPKDVTHVRVSPDVKMIHDGAFARCTKLVRVVFEEPTIYLMVAKRIGSVLNSMVGLGFYEGLTMIGYSAFEGCSALKSIVIPSTVKMIELRAFKDCTALANAELSDGLTTIGISSFKGCSSLESIVLPSTVNEISTYAFVGCNKLMTIELNEGLELIERAAFKGCSSLESVVFPSTISGIKEESFMDCPNLMAIVFNEGLGVIGRAAFKGCSSLASIVLPSTVRSIENWAFSGCTSLKHAILNVGLVEVWFGAFSGCSSLTYINVPATVEEFYEQFDQCTNLAKVKFSMDIDNMPGDGLSIYWRHVISPNVLSKYSFPFQSSVEERVRMLPVTKWRVTVRNMLENMPETSLVVWKHNQTSVHNKLAEYEAIFEGTTTLELAVWKAACIEHCQLHEYALLSSSEKAQKLRINCGAEVIIRNVLVFLL